MKIAGKTLLVAVPGYDANIYKSIRNLSGVTVLPVTEINALNGVVAAAAVDDHRGPGRFPRQGPGGQAGRPPRQPRSKGYRP